MQLTTAQMQLNSTFVSTYPCPKTSWLEIISNMLSLVVLNSLFQLQYILFTLNCLSTFSSAKELDWMHQQPQLFCNGWICCFQPHIDASSFSSYQNYFAMPLCSNIPLIILSQWNFNIASLWCSLNM